MMIRQRYRKHAAIVENVYGLNQPVKQSPSTEEIMQQSIFNKRDSAPQHIYGLKLGASPSPVPQQRQRSYSLATLNSINKSLSPSQSRDQLEISDLMTKCDQQNSSEYAKSFEYQLDMIRDGAEEVYNLIERTQMYKNAFGNFKTELYLNDLNRQVLQRTVIDFKHQIENRTDLELKITRMLNLQRIQSNKNKLQKTLGQ